MKIPKRSDMTAAAIAGKTAKKAGHEFEHRLAELFNKLFGGEHIVDGRPSTKVDMYEKNTNRKYSIKSISKNHTQVALLSTDKFIKHFKIKGNSEKFLRMFFGYPNKECKCIVEEQHPELNLTPKEIHQNRVYKDNIEKKICSSFVTWMNRNKCEIFDVIVRRGFEGDAVDTIIWHKKGSDILRMVALDSMEERVKEGRWTLNNTTLEFRLNDGRKLFHLQMKGSGKKYNSGYHGMMFHIYNINYNQ